MPPPRWTLIDIAYTITATGVKITVTTDVPCHLWMRETTEVPRIHRRPVLRRGLRVRDDVRFCFTVFEDNEQNQAGDTLSHIFIKEPWPVCETRYFYFHGTIGGAFSPSTTAVFTYHRTAPPPATIYYSDPCPGANVCDGLLRETTPFQTWAAIHAAGGDVATCTAIGLSIRIRCSGAAAPANFYNLYRAIMLFDLSPGLGLSVSSAEFKLRGSAKQNTSGASPAINVFTSNPASNGSLVPADFTTLGSTPLATEISYAAFDIAGYNTFNFNAQGLAHINTALGVDGIVKLGLRESNYDAPDINPFPGQKNKLIDMKGFDVDTDPLKKPYLEVVWS